MKRKPKIAVVSRPCGCSVFGVEIGFCDLHHAAGDLLAALKEVLMEYEDYQDGWEKGSAAFAILKAAKAAIRKAEGQ